MVACLALTTACGGSEPSEEAGPNRYLDESLWLCRPGMSDDQCQVHDLTATEILADNSTALVEHEPAVGPPFDCFYVYPTVDINFQPGNHEDFSDIDPMLDPLLGQAAMFTSMCRVFAPLYRQGTIGIYPSPDTDKYLEIAYPDVEEAFRYYLEAEGDNEDGSPRNFVIMGHSQGVHMTRRLLQRVIEPSANLHSRLIVALLIGGDVSVQDGEVNGGSFTDLPLCSGKSDVGCVVAYRSFAADHPPGPSALSGFERAGEPGVGPACNNPAELMTGEQRFGASFFNTVVRGDIPAPTNSYPVKIDTPFVLYRDFFAGQCAKDDSGRHYLAIRAEPKAGDQRVNPVPFDSGLLSPSGLGLHILDYQFPLGDLLALTLAKAEAM